MYLTNILVSYFTRFTSKDQISVELEPKNLYFDVKTTNKGLALINYGIYSLIPPIAVLITAVSLRSLIKALIIGIGLSAAIISLKSGTSFLPLIAEETLERIKDYDSLLLYLFLTMISAFILCLRKVLYHGKYIDQIKKIIKNRKQAEFVAIILSFITSIDDYLSILTVGGTISSIADREHLSRLKLAFLVHSLAGPLVILNPISSWTAAIVSQIHLSGLNNNHPLSGFLTDHAMKIFIISLPFTFYSIILIASLFFIVQKRISFGPIGRDEQYDETNNTSIKFFSTMRHLFIIALPLIIPIALLVILFAIGNLVLDYPLFLIMSVSASIVFFLTFLCGVYKKSFTSSSLPVFVWQGFKFMQGAISILFLGSILASFLHDYLQTGLYLTQLVSLSVPTAFLPLMFFLLSLSITLTTGSAWNTFTLMVTLAFPMTASLFNADIDQVTFLMTFYPLLGAIFSGAVCGDHISPSSETTIMTASSVGITPEVHTFSQMLYVIPVLIATICSFTIVGFLANYPYWLQTSLSSIIGIIISCALIALINRQNKHEQ